MMHIHAYTSIYYLCLCGKWIAQCVSQLTWHVLHLLEPKQLQRSRGMWFFFPRHFTDDMGLMHFSAFFTLQMTWEFAFFGYVRQLPCHLQVLYSDWTEMRWNQKDMIRRDSRSKQGINLKAGPDSFASLCPRWKMAWRKPMTRLLNLMLKSWSLAWRNKHCLNYPI
jgi:hypothetical protein